MPEITCRICDVPLHVEFSATPYQPARTQGPPHLCHPAEGGEVELIRIRIGGQEIPDPELVFQPVFLEDVKDACLGRDALADAADALPPAPRSRFA